MSDTKLIGLYLKGDKEAFGELVSRHQNLVYNLSFRLTGSAADAEDLTQEIFIQLMNKVAGFRGDSKFSTWLYALAMNRGRDWLRSRRRREDPIDDVDGVEAADDPAAAAEAHDTEARVQTALRGLSPDYRTVVVLRDIEGLTYEEVAEVLGLSVGTVKSRLSRGRMNLARILSARGLRAGVSSN